MSLYDSSVLADREVLERYFGYSSFRPGQEKIIQALLSGKDCLVLMPTGGGKSLCYQIPAILLQGVALIVSPLLSLMKDQVDSLVKRGIYAVAWNSNTPEGEDEVIIHDCKSGKVQMLYVSPERLLSLNSSFLNAVPWSFIAVDEAHCVSQWGHDFRPEYSRIGELRKLLPGIQIIALTATADSSTRKDICLQLKLRDPETFIGSFDRPNLSINVRSDRGDEVRTRELFSILKSRHKTSGIIYCNTRKTTEELSHKIRLSGIRCAAYHAGMSLSERNKIQDQFLRGELPLVCATIAFGMGIDKPNIRYIVHYNLPRNMESYYQEIGRAGRDGNPSDTYLFFREKDIHLLKRFALESGRVELNLRKLQVMLEYVHLETCRRRYLLGVFGEKTASRCNNCDQCKKVQPRIHETFNETEIYRKIRLLTKTLAQKFQVAESSICPTEIMHQLCLLQPENAGELLKIKGINIRWVINYGVEFIYLLIHENTDKKIKLSRTAINTWIMHYQGDKIKSISRKFNVQESTICLHLEKMYQYGFPINPDYLISATEFNFFRIGFARNYSEKEMEDFLSRKLHKSMIRLIYKLSR